MDLLLLAALVLGGLARLVNLGPEATTDHTTVKAPSRRDWTAEGAAVFADLSARLGRRPSAREFQQELAVDTRTLIFSEGRLATGSRPPSITAANRVRAALEAVSQADCGHVKAERDSSAQPSSGGRGVQAHPAP
ncbi:hypothetical protein ABH926_000922 [Catenulispora sp. GP43]|uniref:hypothetical protein n=1 Tax=Catenulispora sp. GP43 TaxID=3156263 RepID=UPI003519B303